MVGYNKGMILGELLKEERFDYLRLCREDSSDFILNIPGYHAFLPILCFGDKKWSNLLSQALLFGG